MKNRGEKKVFFALSAVVCGGDQSSAHPHLSDQLILSLIQHEEFSRYPPHTPSLRALPLSPRTRRLQYRYISASLRSCLLMKESPRQAEGPTCLFPNAATFQLQHVCWLDRRAAKASWETGLRKEPWNGLFLGKPVFAGSCSQPQNSPVCPDSEWPCTFHQNVSLMQMRQLPMRAPH